MQIINTVDSVQLALNEALPTIMITFASPI